MRKDFLVATVPTRRENWRMGGPWMCFVFVSARLHPLHTVQNSCFWWNAGLMMPLLLECTCEEVILGRIAGWVSGWRAEGLRLCDFFYYLACWVNSRGIGSFHMQIWSIFINISMFEIRILELWGRRNPWKFIGFSHWFTSLQPSEKSGTCRGPSERNWSTCVMTIIKISMDALMSPGKSWQRSPCQQKWCMFFLFAVAWTKRFLDGLRFVIDGGRKKWISRMSDIRVGWWHVWIEEHFLWQIASYDEMVWKCINKWTEFDWSWQDEWFQWCESCK